MIPRKFPETYSELRKFHDMIADSDEVFDVIFDYNNTRSKSEKQAVIEKYQLSPTQVGVIERWNRIADAIDAYEKSQEVEQPIDLNQFDLSEDEIEFVKVESTEGKAMEVVYKFSKDGNPQHLADFFDKFPNVKAITTVDERTICPADVRRWLNQKATAPSTKE